jgi:hypothetical protein
MKLNMNMNEIEDRLSNALARADAMLLALDGAGLPDAPGNPLVYLAGETRDYIATLRDDVEASRKNAT